MLLCHAAKTAYFRAGVPRLEKAALLASAVRFTGTLIFPILLNQHQHTLLLHKVWQACLCSSTSKPAKPCASALDLHVHSLCLVAPAPSAAVATKQAAHQRAYAIQLTPFMTSFAAGLWQCM